MNRTYLKKELDEAKKVTTKNEEAKNPVRFDFHGMSCIEFQESFTQEADNGRRKRKKNKYSTSLSPQVYGITFLVYPNQCRM